MKLVFTSDLHGKQSHYASFLNLARQHKCAGAIVGGDLFPTSRPYDQELFAQQQFAKTVLRDLFQDHRNQGGCPLYLLPGNNDWQGAFIALEEMTLDGLIAISTATKHAFAGDYLMVAVPYVTPTPFRQKDFDRRDLAADLAPEQPNPVFYSVGNEVRQADIRQHLANRPSLEEELSRLGLAAMEPEKTIYVMHSPPFQTGLDRTAGGIDAGSRAIRTAIEDHQPLLTFHGHIHEAPAVAGAFACRLGQTVAVNPGQSIEHLQAVIVELGPEITLQHTTFGLLTSTQLRQAPSRR